MDYFPCSCPVCNKNDPKIINNLPEEQKQKVLSEHNLYVSFSELQKIKHAISVGRLWEHIEMRAYGHPSLLEALKKVSKYSELIEKQNPITKKSGIFFFSSVGLARPEVIRFKNHIVKRYSVPSEAKILLLVPQTEKKPFSNSKLIENIMKEIQNKLGIKKTLVHVCTYAAPFGVIPTELDKIFPLSQNIITSPFDYETKTYVSKQLTEYLVRSSYKKVILLNDQQYWNDIIKKACAKACKKKQIPFFCEKFENPWTTKDLKNLIKIIKESIMQI
jgi:7-cyano-7-deazaguanine tRNA-ribosyltransferase